MTQERESPILGNDIVIIGLHLQSYIFIILINILSPPLSQYLSDCPDSGRKQQRSCIMGSVVVNGEEDVVHACAINRVDV